MLNTTIDTVQQLTITDTLLSYYVDTLGYSMFYFKDFEVLTTW